jgi:hypothetical protein
VGRGAVATTFVVILAVVLFLAAAGGGFALSRYVGGKPIMPPKQSATPTSTSQSDDAPVELAPRKGNSTTTTGDPGGGFSVPVPVGWAQFVEEISDDKLGSDIKTYYVSPNGTQLLTVERLVGFYPKHTIADYVDRLGSATPDVSISIVYKNAILPLDPPAAQEPGLELKYRATVNAKELVPDDPAALDQNRVTFAHLLPYGGDLWVVSMTVPIEQEDSGDELFGRINPDFKVTG